eukprot:scaffold53_cov126-Skeletonema_menzelii.AAC.1
MGPPEDLLLSSLGSHTSSMRSGLFLVWMGGCSCLIDDDDDDSCVDSVSVSVVSVVSGVMHLFFGVMMNENTTSTIHARYIDLKLRLNERESA